jgi:hypothetical protein
VTKILAIGPDDGGYPGCDVMRIVLATVLTALVLAAPAPAASGIHPLGPKGDVAKGEVPTFRMRVFGKGAVYVHVCRSAKRTNGAICDRETTGRATRGRGGVYTFRPRRFDFPAYFANRSGVYFWQAVRIACQGGDCRQEGPVVGFRVA